MVEGSTTAGPSWVVGVMGAEEGECEAEEKPHPGE